MPSTRSRIRPLAGAALLALALSPRPAAATGMQGHMYMAQCAAEQITDPRLRAVFDAEPLRLANGAFFVDSGYATADHDQGEIAHWEPFIEGYVQIIRERYPSLDTPEAKQHIAFLMGAAAHGITDSTFDALLFDHAEEVDPGDKGSFDTFDMAMDIFLVADRPRYFIPDFAYDAKTLSDVYQQKIPHDTTPDEIDDAMSTAHTGIAVVANLLYKGADEYGARYPWARKHLLDGRTPGGYPFGAKVVTGYYRELLKRLDGDVSADEIVIGTYPSADYPLATLDSTRALGKVVLFFGHGLDRDSINDDLVAVTDDKGTPIPAKVEIFRGDKWPNVLFVKPETPWQPSTNYKVTLKKSIRTLYGESPSKDFELSFTTCAPSSGMECPEPEGAAPASACPELDAKYAARPDDMPPDDMPPDDMPPVDEKPPAAQPSEEAESGGCALSAGQREAGSFAALVVALGAVGIGARRRRGAR